MRVSDVREAVAIGTWGALKGRIVPIAKLNLLVVAPDFLQLRGVSPPLRYLRLLENRAWEDYLGQSPVVSHRNRLIIYHWRSETTVNVTSPFLAFLDLSRDYGFIPLENHIRAALFIVLLAVLVNTYGLQVSGAVWVQSSHFVVRNKLLSVGTTAGVLAVLFGAYKNWPWIRSIVDLLAAGFLATERFFLKAKRL